MGSASVYDDKTKPLNTALESGLSPGFTFAVGIEVGVRKHWEQFKKRLQLVPQQSTFAPGRWSNFDLVPTPLEQQTWGSWSYVFYWVNDAIGPTNLRLGASLYSSGLSWKLVLLAVTLGYFVMAIGLTLNGVVGTKYKIPFIIQSRASFGFFFSFFVVLVRMIVAAFWYGINTATGAQCVYTILIAIWPQFKNVPNHLPESANTTTQFMTAYILYFLFCLPFHWIHPRNLRWFFAIKFFICPPAVMGMLVWACVRSGGGTDNPVFHRGNVIQGNALTWAFMGGLNAMLGSYAPLAVNM